MKIKNSQGLTSVSLMSLLLYQAELTALKLFLLKLNCFINLFSNSIFWHYCNYCIFLLFKTMVFEKEYLQSVKPIVFLHCHFCLKQDDNKLCLFL